MKNLKIIGAILVISAAAPGASMAESAWQTYCAARTAVGIYCTEAMYEASIGTTVPVTSNKAAVPKFVMGYWGTTTSDISSQFPPNLLATWIQNPAVSTQIANMYPLLALMSTELKASDIGGTYTRLILDLIAEKATSGAELQWIMSAFGPAAVTEYVIGYATPTVQAQYKALPVLAPMPYSAYYYEKAGIAAPSANAAESYLQDLAILTFVQGTDTVQQAIQKSNYYARAITKSAGINAITKQIPMPGPAVSWIAIVLGIVAANCPNCLPDFWQAYADGLTQTNYIWVPTIGDPITIPQPTINIDPYTDAPYSYNFYPDDDGMFDFTDITGLFTSP
jgi:hypothetical protein